MIQFAAAALVLLAWGALALGLVLGCFTLLDAAHERLTGKAWLR